MVKVNMKVRLRAMEPEDLDLLYRIENDADLWAVGATNVPYSRYTLHDYIATSADDIFADRQLRLIIEDAQEGFTVGMADLINFDPRHRRAEVGIVIEQPHRRKDYAKAALEALHDYARRVIHLHQLYAIIGIDNQPARRLFQSMGYLTTATLVDWILRSDETYVDAEVMQLVI
jgi:diamine N-acetyltransferase